MKIASEGEQCLLLFCNCSCFGCGSKSEERSKRDHGIGLALCSIALEGEEGSLVDWIEDCCFCCTTESIESSSSNFWSRGKGLVQFAKNFDRLQTSLGNSELEGSECLVWEESCLNKLLLGEGEQRSIDLTRKCEQSKVVWWVCTNCFCSTTNSTKQFSRSFWNEWCEGFCFDSDTRIANEECTSTSVLGQNEDLG